MNKLFKFQMKRFTTKYKMIKTKIKNSTKIIQLYRPYSLNAICSELIHELNLALKFADSSSKIRSIIITGCQRSFSVGEDIKEILKKEKLNEKDKKENLLNSLNYIRGIKKPIIAAVEGYCLGSGFELAMMCDMIISTRDAKFGLPEIKFGIIPNKGGTQRLIKEVGKSKAMEIILTGDFYFAQDISNSGLFFKLIEKNSVKAALEICQGIDCESLLDVFYAKKCIDLAYEVNLKTGGDFEKEVFYETFEMEDFKEGLKAFFDDKRKPEFKDK